MQIGELLVVGPNASISTFTPWMFRRADNARLTYEIIGSTGTYSLTVEVYHRESDASGPGDVLSVGSWTESDSFRTVTAVGLREMIRFKITLEESGGSGDPAVVIYRFLEPTWFDQASDTNP